MSNGANRHFKHPNEVKVNKHNIFLNVHVEAERLTAAAGTRGWASAPPSASAWAGSEPRSRSYEAPEAQHEGEGVYSTSLKLESYPNTVFFFFFFFYLIHKHFQGDGHIVNEVVH